MWHARCGVQVDLQKATLARPLNSGYDAMVLERKDFDGADDSSARGSSESPGPLSAAAVDAAMRELLDARKWRDQATRVVVFGVVPLAYACTVMYACVRQR